LDDDGGGSIGIEELQEPLIGLGFADTLEQVQELVDAVDEDKSGCIEFDEFIGIIKNSGKNKSTQDITEFFEKLTTGGFDM
jgi:Ca2+-binding EF-hand superfamily protein